VLATNGRILASVARRAKLNNPTSSLIIRAFRVVDISQELCTLSYSYDIVRSRLKSLLDT